MTTATTEIDAQIEAIQRQARKLTKPLGSMTYEQIKDLERQLLNLGAEITKLRRKKAALKRAAAKGDK